MVLPTLSWRKKGKITIILKSSTNPLSHVNTLPSLLSISTVLWSVHLVQWSSLLQHLSNTFLDINPGPHHEVKIQNSSFQAILTISYITIASVSQFPPTTFCKLLRISNPIDSAHCLCLRTLMIFLYVWISWAIDSMALLPNLFTFHCTYPLWMVSSHHLRTYFYIS